MTLASGSATLVVNADDFGITDGTCRAILRCGNEGVLTSTSVLAVGPAAARWAAALADSGLGVGCHLALVGEDPPLCPARDIPTLVDRRGRFPASWRMLAARLAAGRIDPADVRREWSAQIDALARWGLTVDHLDTHQHVHLLRSLGAVVCELATEHHGVPIRRPMTARRGPITRAVGAMSADLARTAAAASIVAYPSWGIDDAGQLRADDIIGRVVALGNPRLGIFEISAHPGGAADHQRDRYAWDYQWEREADALCSPELRRAIDRSSLVLGTCGGAVLPPAV